MLSILEMPYIEEKPKVMTIRETESQLLQRIRKGDKGAYIELVNPYQERLFRKAKSMLGSEDDAEDVVQEALIAGFKSIENFRADSGVYTWLYRIVVNKSKDVLFKKKRVMVNSISEHEDMLIDNRNSFENNLELSDESKYILKKLDELEEEYRQVIELRYYEELSYSDMAAVIGCNIGTVKSRLFKAKELLKHLIQKDEKGGDRNV